MKTVSDSQVIVPYCNYCRVDVKRGGGVNGYRLLRVTVNNKRQYVEIVEFLAKIEQYKELSKR